MNISSRSRARSFEFGLLAALLTVGACAPPPRGPVAGSDRTLPPPPSDRADSLRPAYDFELEGEFPPPAKDVVFEEDHLPPRPENVDATPLGESGVRASDLPDPPPDAASDLRSSTVVPPVQPSVSTPVESVPAPMRMGFRVQLIAAADRLEAETFARQARARLGVTIHVDFEAPYYKVRAGDFTDRADALVMRDRARAQGYEGAWVTATRIAP